MINVKPLGRVLVLVLALGLLSSVGANAAEKKKTPHSAKSAKAKRTEAPPAARRELEPKAMEILKASCDRLAAARTMNFTAVVTHENPSRLGTPLAYMSRSEVTLQRPDKLRVITPADGPPTEFYYDGTTMTAFAPAENLVAVAPAPATIDSMLAAAFTSAAIYFPFTDLIVTEPYKDLVDGLVVAFYIGQSHVVGGTTTDMIAYGNKDVFVQVWIGVEDKLPRLVRAVYLADRAALRHQMELSNWQLDPALPADSFTAAKAAGANPIAFAHPIAQLPSAMGPQGKSKPPKTKGTSK